MADVGNVCQVVKTPATTAPPQRKDKFDHMGSSVRFYEDAASFSSAAEEFLLSRPVLHNVILTRLADCLTRHEPGRYWVATKDGQVSGLYFNLL